MGGKKRKVQSATTEHVTDQQGKTIVIELAVFTNGEARVMVLDHTVGRRFKTHQFANYAEALTFARPLGFTDTANREARHKAALKQDAREGLS